MSRFYIVFVTVVILSTIGLDLTLWISSIQNQLWWSFGTSQGNLALLQEKIDSIAEHLCNIHCFPENQHFRQCGHDPLPSGNRLKAWLSPHSLVSYNSSDK